MPRGDRRDEIMQAAERLFTSRRIHEVTLDQIAREAKVGKGTIYLYFEDKDDLFFQTVNTGFDDLCALVRQQAGSARPFREKLLQTTVAVIGFFERRRQLFALMQTEEARMHWCKGVTRERWMKRRRELVAVVGEIMALGVREGVVRSDLPPDYLATFLLGMLRTRARDLSDAPADMRSPERIVDLFCMGATSR